MECKVGLFVVLVVLGLVAFSIGEPCPENVQPGKSFVDWSNPNCGITCTCRDNGQVGGCTRLCERRERRAVGGYDCPPGLNDEDKYWNALCGIECVCKSNGMAKCTREACDPTRPVPPEYA